MESDFILLSQAQQEGTAPRAYVSGAAQRDFLSQQNRLPVAQLAHALCSLAYGLSLLPSLEKEWLVGGHSHASAGDGSLAGGAPAPCQRRDHRQPERQEYRMQRRARLRRGQENQGAQAAHFGRYVGPAPDRDGVASTPSGSRRRQTVALGLLCPNAAPTRQTHLGGWWL